MSTPTGAPSPGAPGVPLVELRGVSVSHDGRTTWALRDLDLTVAPGERWVVLGPNGSGKSTLVQLVTGWLHPSEGELVLLGGRLGHGVDWRALRTRIGVVSASFAKLLRPEITALDVVMTARYAALEPWWHRYDDADRARARDLLAAAGFAHVADRRFGVLSEGERQQVLLARTLMGRAELLVLDEPAAGLDLGARERLVARMGQVATGADVPGMVLVTHHLEEIPAAMTHALVLRAGRSLAQGAITDVLRSAVVSEAFDVDVEVTQRAGRWSATVR